MNCPDFPGREIFMARMEKARTQNPALYLAAIAVIHTPGTNENIDRTVGHTRGDFKRAVKILRVQQKETPQRAAIYEGAIAYIRAEWLRRKAGADTYPGQLICDAGPAPEPGRRQNQAAGENRGELVG